MNSLLSGPGGHDQTAPDGANLFNEQWLSLLTWQLLLVDGEVARYRVHSPVAMRDWLILRPAALPSESIFRRIGNEFDLRDQLDPAWAIIPVAQLASPEGPLLVLDESGGRSLHEMLGEPLSIARFLYLAIGAAHALDQAHAQGLLHRDIKPCNFIEGADGTVRLTSFALSAPKRLANALSADSISGSLAYMSPEQAGRGAAQVDERSDLYSLGVSFYELLTGRLPFAGADPVEWLHQHVALQPSPPEQLREGLPTPLSRVVLKLLAKDPAARYSCASALEADLRFCLAQWNEFQHIRDFEPGGVADRSGDGMTSRLVCREAEMAMLHHCVKQVARTGERAIVLVSGNAGVGKTALVRQLHEDIAGSKVLLAVGKSDQFHRTTPYSSLALILRALIVGILGEPPEELDAWRAGFHETLGAQGRLVSNLAPELELLTGPLPDVSDLSLHDTQQRFNSIVLRFIQLFASAQCPLILFFDDLQWLDNDTLSFFAVLAEADIRYLTLIGAYRDTCEDRSQGFVALLGDLRGSGMPLTQVALAPLDIQGVGELLGSVLEIEADSLGRLSQVMYARTAGNPFFVNQLLQLLLDEGVIDQARDGHTWVWDTSRLLEFPVAPNVGGLMVTRIGRLPPRTRHMLGLLALIGSRADEDELASFSGLSIEDVHRYLAPALASELLFIDQSGLMFSHDRVREAAYFLIPADLRPVEHARMARLLIERMQPGEVSGVLFRAALHIQQALHDALPTADRALFIETLLEAARRASHSAAVAFALQYLALAQSLGGESRWRDDYLKNYQIDFLQARCLIHTAQYGEADERLAQLLERVYSLSEVSAIYVLKVELCSQSGDHLAAVQAGLEGLAMFGVDLRGPGSADTVEIAYARYAEKLGQRSIASLADLPPLKHSFAKGAIELLVALIMPASFTDQHLWFLVLCRTVQMTLQHGATEVTPIGLGWFGVALGHHFGRYHQGLEYAHAALAMVEHHGYVRSEAMTLLAVDQASVWLRPLSTSLGCAERAFTISRSTGDPSLRCYASSQIVATQLVMGLTLERVAQQVDIGLGLCRELDFHAAQVIFNQQAFLVQALRGGEAGPEGGRADTLSNPDHNSFAQPLPAERRLLPYAMAPAVFSDLVLKGIIAFTFRDFKRARTCLRAAEDSAWSTHAHVHTEHGFFSALALAALHDPEEDPAGCVAAIEPYIIRLREWAALNPASFRDRLLLVEAEVARLQGRGLEAMKLYESAIRQAISNGLVHMEALAHELAGSYHESLGLVTAGHSHFRSAREAYQRWGATLKVRDLEQRHLYLHDQPLHARSSIDLAEGQQQLDMLSVTKASQALSREIVQDRLIETLMTNTIIHAGARRGVLILMRAGTPLIAAIGQVLEGSIDVDIGSRTVDATQLPLSMLYTVLRTRQPIALDQASSDPLFARDAFFVGRPANSVLCLPLLKQDEVMGVLYLENDLASGVFTRGRIAILELLAAQAAISLETSRLYAELLEENLRRREIEAALLTSQALLAIGQKMIHSGTFRWDTSVDKAFWSDELYAIWGFNPAAPAPDRNVLVQLVHQDDRQRFRTMLDRAVRTHMAFRLAFRVITPAGEFKHLEVMAEPAAEHAFVGVLSDVSGRKTTEMALRNARAELAQVSHATMMGELAASIAHEINQPLVSIVSNASASVRWLKRDMPQVAEALEGLQDIATDGKRAADIVTALQALARQKPPNRSLLQIDEVVHHVLTLTSSEIEQKQVALSIDLAAGSTAVYADSVQMQQVVLNLVMNAVDAMLGVEVGRRRLLITSRVEGGDQVVVTVEDTGPGISDENAGQIFNAFFTTKKAGMGMGLAICRSIINAQDGTLHALRDRGGRTVFMFTLPGVVPA